MATKIYLGRLNNYKIFSTLVFLLSSYWIRRFFTNQSIVLPSSKAILPFIDVALPMALPIIVDSQWFHPR